MPGTCYRHVLDFASGARLRQQTYLLLQLGDALVERLDVLQQLPNRLFFGEGLLFPMLEYLQLCRFSSGTWVLPAPG